MSEIIKLSTSEIKGWLESKTNPIYYPFRTKAQKSRDKIVRSLENLEDASNVLLESSERELYGKSPYSKAGSLNKLAHLFLERIKQIKIPDQVTYENFLRFAQETQEAFLFTEVDVKNWFWRIAPHFDLERREFLASFEKAKESLRELNDLVAKEYVKIRTLEETFQFVDELKTLEEQHSNLNKQRKSFEDEQVLLEKEIVKTRQRMVDLKGCREINQLEQIDIEIESLCREVKYSLQHLQKPFIKLQSLKLHGEEKDLTLEESNKLNKYIENPFEALVTEDAEYLLLRQILQKTARLMHSGKLKLKPDKERKAQQVIDKILNTNSLAILHQNSVDATIWKKQLLTSAKLAETKNNILQLQESIEELERSIRSIESEKKIVEKDFNETLVKIQNHKNQIEKNILDFMGKIVHIE